MKTLGDAILVRNRIIEALDIADNHPDEAERKAMLTVVVAGGGFAGTETAGAVNDLLREAIKFYPKLKEDMLRIVLVHAGDVILPELSGTPRAVRQKQLGRRGVDIRLHTAVTGYDGRELTLNDGTQHRHPPGDLDRGHHTVAAIVGSALRHTAGPRAGKRMSCKSRTGPVCGRLAIARSYRIR